MSVVGAWNFDNVSEGGVVYDDKGSHNGSVVGSVPLIPGPVSSKGRQFSGDPSTNRITIPAHADFGFHHDATVEVMGNVGSAVFTNNPVLICKGTSSYQAMRINVNTTSGWTFYIRAYGGSSSVYYYAGFKPVAGEFFHVAMTWDYSEATMRAYLNGSLLGEYTQADSWGQDPYDVTFGGREDEPSGDWDGQIHAVRWWDELVSTPDIYNIVHGSDVKEAPHL